MSAGRIAILIDGGFFLRRLPKLVAANRCESPGKIVACVRHMCRNHIKTRDLIALRDLWRSLDGSSVRYGLRQKGVDMRIGLDITTLTLKKQVDTIILVSGDSDFVPAAKLARREGIEFILDPLWQKVNADLFEHVDGLQSGLKRPGTPPTSQGAAPTTANESANASED